MDTRTIYDIISEVLVEVERLSQIPEQIATHKDQIDLCLLRTIESRIAFDVLFNVLKTTVQQKTLNLHEILAQYHHIYEIRWRLIHHTDCSYTIAPNLPINKAWMLVAEKLAPLEDKHAYNWLMPTVEFPSSCYAYQLHEFLIGSDGVPLPLEDCFEFLAARAGLPQRRRSGHKLLHPNETQEVHTAIKFLSMRDEHMISEHSLLAKEYYEAIFAYDNVQSAKEKFKLSLQQGNIEVLASYGEQGRGSLMRSLLANVNTLLGMTDFLFKHVPKIYWKYFLNSLNHDDLFNITLRLNLNDLRKQAKYDDFGSLLCTNTNTILRQLSDVRFVFNYEDELRALMLCLLQAYRISRKEGPEFKSSFGYVGSLFSWAHSKEDRILSCDVLVNFLVSDPPHPLSDFIGYLTKNHFNEHIASLTVGAYIDYNNTTLFKLARLMMDSAVQFTNKLEPDDDKKVCRV